MSEADNNAPLLSATSLEPFVLQDRYYIDGAVIKWRDRRVTMQGKDPIVMLGFDVIDERNRIAGSFEIPTEKIERREDVTVRATEILNGKGSRRGS